MPSWKHSPKDFSPPPHLVEPGLNADPNKLLAHALISGAATTFPTSVALIWPLLQLLYLHTVELN